LKKFAIKINYKMVTELGYCNLCEKQKPICPKHHCKVCYELYCEDCCYYEKIYENECIEFDSEDSDTDLDNFE
jgi:hypothetical protein